MPASAVVKTRIPSLSCYRLLAITQFPYNRLALKTGRINNKTTILVQSDLQILPLILDKTAFRTFQLSADACQNTLPHATIRPILKPDTQPSQSWKASMNLSKSLPNIRQWTLQSHCEPLIRVGIVLSHDFQDTLHLRIPEHRYTMDSGSSALANLKPHGNIAVALSDNKLSVYLDEKLVFSADSIRISPADRIPLETGSGILVRDVVAGRGFHWQKCIDQTLTGSLEISAGKHGIICVNKLPLEDYLAGVITAEMSGTSPADLLKAQCVVARSWLLAMTESKHDDDPFDRCNDDCCQRYQGTGEINPTAIAAVRDTRGLTLLSPAGTVLDANYSKSCGGISEDPRVVWNVAKPGILPIVDTPAEAPEKRFFPITVKNLDEYLDGDWISDTAIYCSPRVVPREAIKRYLGRVDEVDDYFRWTVRYQCCDLEQLIKDKLPQADTLAILTDLRVTERGVSGRASKLEIEWETKSGAIAGTTLDTEYMIRDVLHRKFLYSSAFAYPNRTRQPRKN